MLAQVEHEDAAAGHDDARRFGERALGLAGMVERLGEERHVDAGVPDWELLQLAALPGDVADPAAGGERLGALQHRGGAIDGQDTRGPPARLDGEVALAAAKIRDLERRQEVAEGPGPCGPS